MGIIETLIISVALAMDAFAVSIACGISKKKISIFNIIKVGLFFGLFQGLMPFLGYIFGNLIPFDITAFDHWIAFVLLGFIGVSMIRESSGSEDDDVSDKKDLFKTWTLFIAAIATSIDALAAGFSFSLLGSGIMLLVISATLITLITSIIGVIVGSRFGHIFEKKIELIAGSVLILLGIKIVIEHTFF